MLVIAANRASPINTEFKLKTAVPASNTVKPQSRLNPTANRVLIESFRRWDSVMLIIVVLQMGT
ncbi:hypothetical protein D9M71_638920 [compost metagenome]